MATHSSVLAWRIPGTVEPDGLPSMGSHRVGHDGSDLAAAAAVAVLYLLSICDTINKFLITDSISLLVIALFRYSVHGLVFVGFVLLAVCAFYLAYPTC